MRERLELEQRVLNGQRRNANGASGGDREGGVGAVVSTVQARAAELEALLGGLLHDRLVEHRKISAGAADLEHATLTALGLAAALVVTLGDKREIAVALADEGVALGVRIVLKRGVAVQM